MRSSSRWGCWVIADDDGDCISSCNSYDLTISQAHRLRMESIALHRYFLNRKFNVHKGISLSAAIESSLSNVSIPLFLLLEELTHFAQRCRHGRLSLRHSAHPLPQRRKEAKVMMNRLCRCCDCCSF